MQREEAQIVINLKADQSINQLGVLQNKAKDLQKQISETQKAAEEFDKLTLRNQAKQNARAGTDKKAGVNEMRDNERIKALAPFKEINANAQKELEETNQKYKSLKDTLGLASMTMAQLAKESRNLQSQLSNTLDPETAKQLNKELGEVNIELYKQNQKLKESKEAWALLSNGARLETIISETERASRSVKLLRDTEKLLIEQLESGTLSNEKQINYQNELKETQKQLNKLTIDAKKADEQLDRTKEFEGFEKMRKSTKLAAMSINELTRYVQLANEKLGDMDRGSEAFRKLRREVNLANAEIDQHTRKVKFNLITYMKAEGLDSSFESIIGDIALKAFYLPFELFAKGVEKLKLLSDQLTNIEKKAGMSKKEVASLNEEIMKIDTRTSADDLREIAIAGGAIGIAKEDLKDFVVETNKLNVALGDEFESVQDVAKEVGKLKTLFAETKDMKTPEAMSRIGSAMNELGNVGVATGAEMTDFALRVGALGNLSPEISQVLGLGSALVDLGLTQEIAASGVSSILLSANDNQKEFLRQINLTRKGVKMTADEFKNLYNNDPNKLLMELSKSFAGLKTDQVISQLGKMDIKNQEAVKTMLLLANNTDLVTKRQEIAAKAFKENTSITNEAAKMEENFAGQLAKAGKEFDKAGMTIMNAFLPSLMALLKGFFTFIEVLKALPKFLNDYKLTIGVVVASLVAFNFTMAISAMGSLALARKLVVMRAAVRANIRAFRMLRTTMMANPFIAVAVVLTALGVAFYETYQRSQAFRANIAGVWNTLKVFGNILITIKEAIGALFDFDDAAYEKAKQKLGELGQTMKNAFARGRDNLLNEEDLAAAQKEYKKKKENEITYKSEAELKETKGSLGANPSVNADIVIPDKPKGESKADKQKSEHEKFLKMLADQNKEILANRQEFSNQNLSEDAKELANLDKKFFALISKNLDAQTEIAKNENLSAAQKLELQENLQKQLQNLRDQQFAEESAKLKEQADKKRNLQLKSLEESTKLEIEFGQGKAEISNQLFLLDLEKSEREFEEKYQANEKQYEDLRLQAEKHGLEMMDFDSFMSQKFLEEYYSNEDAKLEQQKTAEQKAIEAENKRFELQKAKLKGNNAEIEKIEKAHKAKLETLEKSHSARKLESFQKFGSEFAGLLGALNTFIGQEGGQMTGFQKSLAIAQIAIDTAVAMSAMIKDGAIVGVTPLEKAITIATGLTLVITNMAKATAILNTAQTNQVYTQKKAEFSKGGKTDTILAGNTSHSDGGLPIIDPKTGQKIAEIESGEMILSRKTVANNPFLVNELLKSSMFENGKSILPKIQGSFQPSKNVSSRFENGGIFGNLQTNQNSSLDLSPILQQNEQVAQIMKQIMEKMNQPSEAFITYKNLDKSLGEMKDIKRQADIFNL